MRESFKYVDGTAVDIVSRGKGEEKFHKAPCIKLLVSNLHNYLSENSYFTVGLVRLGLDLRILYREFHPVGHLKPS